MLINQSQDGDLREGMKKRGQVEGTEVRSSRDTGITLSETLSGFSFEEFLTSEESGKKGVNSSTRKKCSEVIVRMEDLLHH